MIRHIPIDTSTSGNTELVAAVAGYPIVVIAYTLVCNAAVNVKFSDGADLSRDYLPLQPVRIPTPPSQLVPLPRIVGLPAVHGRGQF